MELFDRLDACIFMQDITIPSQRKALTFDKNPTL